MRKYLVLTGFCLYSLVSDGQNVGIGVPNPQNKLHVGGGFRLDTLTGVGGAGLLSHNPNGVVYGIKFTGNTSDVLRGDGSFGSLSGSGINYWSTNGTHIYNNNSGYVGIGTTTPGSGLELSGPGLGAQQRITDPVSGNSLVLQGGPGESLKVTGFNYGTGTAQPLYLSVDGANTIINPNFGNVGIGTTNPGTRLTVHSTLYGIEHTNGTVRLSTYLDFNGAWLGTKSNHPLHFYTNDGTQQMTLNQAGQVGIGTTTPLAGYRLDINGYARSFANQSVGFVSHTTGSTNAWARFYMRATDANGQNGQSWFIGTSRNFNGNQLYIGDETYNQTRLTIQPNGGPIYMQGNITQDVGGYGLPKAMIYMNGDGTILRCYNGMTGVTAGGCGFTTTRLNSGLYRLTFGFDASAHFLSLTVENLAGPAVSVSYYFSGNLFIKTELSDGTGTDRPVMIIVY